MADLQIPKPQRPNWPDYGISAKKEGMMSWEWVNEQMTKSRNYWICSAKPDGRPHAAPVWGVWADGVLYFSTSRNARKGRNLLARPDVVVHLESGDETVILDGRVTEVIDKATLKHISKIYGDKYPGFAPDPEPAPGNLTFQFNVHTALAWLEKDYPKTATKWVFDIA